MQKGTQKMFTNQRMIKKGHIDTRLTLKGSALERLGKKAYDTWNRETLVRYGATFYLSKKGPRLKTESVLDRNHSTKQ